MQQGSMHQRRTALLVVLYGLLCVAALSYSQQLFQVRRDIALCFG